MQSLSWDWTEIKPEEDREAIAAYLEMHRQQRFRKIMEVTEQETAQAFAAHIQQGGNPNGVGLTITERRVTRSQTQRSTRGQKVVKSLTQVRNAQRVVLSTSPHRFSCPTSVDRSVIFTVVGIDVQKEA